MATNPGGVPLIHLTLDLDWAPDFVLAPVFAELARAGVAATVFATHATPLLQSPDPAWEIGLHPALSDLAAAAGAIASLKEAFPQARCLRNHSLVMSSRLLPLLAHSGITCTSHYAMYGMAGIAPVRLPFDVVEYPIWYMDDVHALCWDEADEDGIVAALFDTPGVKVLAFHPIHIYLNSSSLDAYEAAKADLENPEHLARCRQPGRGVGRFFSRLLAEPRVVAACQRFPATVEAFSFFAAGEGG